MERREVLVKMAKNISTAEKLGNELRDSYERWNHILQNGAGDPLWEDGSNMNLVRNHIIYYKRQCEAELLPEEYPEEYFWGLPTEVDNKYMALPEEIRKHAIESLTAYEANEDYQYLKEAVNKLTEKQKSQISIMNVINYVTGLKSFIKKDSLVEMRMHEHPERYLESFQDCRKKAEAIMNQEPEEKPLPTGQLSLFDLFGLTMGG